MTSQLQALAHAEQTHLAPRPGPPVGAEVRRDSIDASTLSRAVRRGYPWIAGAAVAGLVLGFLASVAMPNSYESYAVVRFDAPVVDQLSQVGVSSSSDDDGLELEALSDAVMLRAAGMVGLDASAREVRQMVDATQVGNDAVVELVANTNDPALSEELVNAVARAMLLERTEEVDGQLEQVGVNLDAEIATLESEIADLDAQIQAAIDPALLIERDSVDQQLSLLTAVDVQAGQDARVTTSADIEEQIQALQATLLGIDEQIAASTDTELNVRRSSAEEQLSVLNSLSVRSGLFVALPGEILRAGIVPAAPVGTSPTTNGIALALVFGGLATFALSLRARTFVTGKEVTRLVGAAPIATISRKAVVSPEDLLDTPDMHVEDSMRRVDLWMRLNGTRRVVFVTVGTEPVASMIVRRLAFARRSSGASRVIDFEREVLRIGTDAFTDDVVHLHSVKDLPADSDGGEPWFIVSPPAERSSRALEISYLADAVILVVDTETASFESCQEAIELMSTVGVRPDGAILLEAP